VKEFIGDGVGLENKVNIAEKKTTNAFRGLLKAEKEFYLSPSETNRGNMEHTKSTWQEAHRQFLASILALAKTKIKKR